MRFELIDAEKAKYPIDVLCDALDVSRSGYYAWKGRPASARAKADEQLGVEIVAIHRRSRRTYGSPRVHADLRAKGRRVGKKRVERLMRKTAWQPRESADFVARPTRTTTAPSRPTSSNGSSFKKPRTRSGSPT